MDTSLAATPAPATTELEHALAQARTGGMQIGELLDRANQLHQQGLAEASAALYESWLAHTHSPLRHVACFNWGTALGAMGRHAQALGIGAMTPERIKDFYAKMVHAGLYKAGEVDLSQVATMQFVNKGVGVDLKKQLTATK